MADKVDKAKVVLLELKSRSTNRGRKGIDDETLEHNLERGDFEPSRTIDYVPAPTRGN